MKKIIAIIVMLIVLGFVNSAVIIERPSAASAAAAVQAQIPDPVRPLPSLQSLTFYEQSTGIGLTPLL
jgi:hypothetical protein